MLSSRRGRLKIQRKAFRAVSGRAELTVSLNDGAQNDNTENTENEDALPAPQQEAVPAGMVLIPAGTFQMGSNSRWMPNNQHNIDWHASRDESPIHTVTLDAFYMDTHEVTNAEYTEFLNAKGENINTDHVWHWPGIDIVLDHRSGKYTVLKGYENHLVFSVSWYGAMAYANWAGKRLPTEAEWEYAARGGLAGKEYPWGDTFDSTRANCSDNNIDDTTAVGSYAPNGYGLYDMAGNVYEWCLDVYNYNFYAILPARNPLSGAPSIQWLLDNYEKTDSHLHLVLRGGSWSSDALRMRVAYRYHYSPTLTYSGGGFRCVKSLTP